MKAAASNKILVTIPFWDGDRYQVEIQAKFLADLQKGHSELADILFVNRFDAKPLRPEIIKYVSRKFNVMQYRSKRKETGWPSGCSSLWFGMLEYVYHKQVAKQIPHYKALFNMASDVVPLKRDWVEYLHAQWDAMQPAAVAGALIEGPRDHINGDAMLMTTRPDFLRWLVNEVGGIKQRAGWDWVLAPDFCARGWKNIDGIKSLWQTPTMTLQDAKVWMGRDVALIHGVKDASLLDAARKLLL